MTHILTLFFSFLRTRLTINPNPRLDAPLTLKPWLDLCPSLVFFWTGSISVWHGKIPSFRWRRKSSDAAARFSISTNPRLVSRSSNLSLLYCIHMGARRLETLDAFAFLSRGISILWSTLWGFIFVEKERVARRSGYTCTGCKRFSGMEGGANQ